DVADGLEHAVAGTVGLRAGLAVVHRQLAFEDIGEQRPFVVVRSRRAARRNCDDGGRHLHRSLGVGEGGAERVGAARQQRRQQVLVLLRRLVVGESGGGRQQQGGGKDGRHSAEEVMGVHVGLS